MLLLLWALLAFPALFVLGPLAGLLAASRPRSIREWCWIGAALLWVVVIGSQPVSFGAQALCAWALFVTGAFVLLMLVARVRVVTGALVAVSVSFILTTIWLAYLQLDWRALQFAVSQSFMEAVLRQVETGPDLLGNADEVRQWMSVLKQATAGLLPALFSIAILPPLAIAWSWYRRLAGSPLGAPAERFAEFRFSDQLIWGVVLGAVAMVLPVPAPYDVVIANLALVIGTLYFARGAAIIWSRIEGLHAALLTLLLLLAIPLFPALFGAAFALGVADTWVDFRRRAAPVEPTRE